MPSDSLQQLNPSICVASSDVARVKVQQVASLNRQTERETMRLALQKLLPTASQPVHLPEERVPVLRRWTPPGAMPSDPGISGGYREVERYKIP
ncbi:hypothetical protein L596_009960 [Steinernema carpocapsae]|uniref:Uncharacterized protein n=1 Tax=Steinernema carpocapsae TaxID=34508 RepID=A0A4U5PHD7_STECR|nr:hypothetical protein L596_009960 [Steinernema carpocapsae]